MQIKGIWGRERDVNLVNGIQVFIPKPGNTRLLASLKGKTGENWRLFLPPAVFYKGLGLHGSHPGFGQLSGKSAGKGNKHMSRHSQHRLWKTVHRPRSTRWQYVNRESDSVSKRYGLQELVLMPKERHCLFELLLINFLFII